MLSATPADNYNDLVSLFIANGYFKNKTEFNMCHVVFKPYMKYPVVDHYIGTGTLNYYRRQMYVIMDSQQKKSIENLKSFDASIPRKTIKSFGKRDGITLIMSQLKNLGKLCYLLRREL